MITKATILISLISYLILNSKINSGVYMKPNIFQIIIILLFVFFIATTLSYSQDKEYDELKEKIQKLDNLPSREYNKMLDKCDKLIKKYETSDKKIVAEVYLWSSLIKLQINRRRGDAVITDLNLGLKYNPQNSELHRELGLAYRDQGETKSAIASLKTSIELNDKDITAITALIEIYQPNNQTNSIIDLRQMYLRQKPDDFEMWFGLALDQLSLEDTSSAITSFENAINVNKKFTKARFKLAEIKEQSGDLEGAKSEYKAILSYDKNNEKAKTSFEKVENRSRTKTRMEDLLEQGKRYFLSSNPRDWARSIAYFDTVWVYEPQNAEVIKYRKLSREKVYTHCYNEGERMMKQGRWNDAVNHFKISVGCADTDSDKTRAFNKLEEAAKKAGISLAAQNALSEARRLVSTGEFGEALNWFITAGRIYPPSVKGMQDDRDKAQINYYYFLGKEALDDSDYVAAKTYFGEVKKINPSYKDVSLLYDKADILLSLNIVEKKIKEYYKKEMEKEDWNIAYGLALFLKKYFNNDIELQRDLKYIESKQRPLLNYTFFYFISVICGLLFLIAIHLYGNSRERRELWNQTRGAITLKDDIYKKASWIKFIFVLILFLLMNFIIGYIIIQDKGTSLATKILSFISLFPMNWIVLIPAKFYLRNYLRLLSGIGEVIEAIPPKIKPKDIS